MQIAAGSITKNFVAALVLQLAEEGALSLDDPLHRWLPRYPKVASSITVRQLLGHTSRLHMFWENQKLWDDLIVYRDGAFAPETVIVGSTSTSFVGGFRGHLLPSIYKDGVFAANYAGEYVQVRKGTLLKHNQALYILQVTVAVCITGRACGSM